MSAAPQSTIPFTRAPGGAGDGPSGRRRPGPPPPPRDLQALFDRLPPHSPESEMSLLGAMILDPKVIADVIAIVPSADDLYSQAHAAIFDALVRTFDRHHSGDLVQLTEALRDKQVLDEVGGIEYLARLAESVPSAVNAPLYARIVREKAQLRRLIDAAGRILYDAYHAEGGDNAGAAREVLDGAEQMIFNIADQSIGGDAETLQRLLQQTLDILDANFRHGRSITGLATGFYDLDELTSGLQKGELIIVAARPSMGKTALALNLAEQIAFGGSPHDERGPHTPVGIFSMEMSRQAVAQRLLCAHSGVDSQKMRRNLLSHDDFRLLAESCGRLSEAQIHIDDTAGLTILSLRAKARRMVAQHGVRCIFVDYLQLMSAPSAARESRQAEVSAISRGIKALARELNIPVICLAQLNRSAEQREGHRPRMADLRESGSIEQDADVIILLHRESYFHDKDSDWAMENADRIHESELIIAKQRNGPTGTVFLKWNPEITRFQNLATRTSAPFESDHPSPQPRRSAPRAPQGSAPAEPKPIHTSGAAARPEPGYNEAGDDEIPI